MMEWKFTETLSYQLQFNEMESFSRFKQLPGAAHQGTHLCSIH